MKSILIAHVDNRDDTAQIRIFHPPDSWDKVCQNVLMQQRVVHWLKRVYKELKSGTMQSVSSVLPFSWNRIQSYVSCTAFKHTQRQTERYGCLQHRELNQIAGIISDYSVHVSSLFQEGSCLPWLMRTSDTAENHSSSPAKLVVCVCVCVCVCVREREREPSWAHVTEVSVVCDKTVKISIF